MYDKFFYWIFAISFCSLFTISTSIAQPINQVDYDDLTGNEFIDFENISGGTPIPQELGLSGFTFNNVISFSGARFGERFAGQTLTVVNQTINSVIVGFDSLSGQPSAPLTVLPGEQDSDPSELLPTDNLSIVTENANGFLIGIGPLNAIRVDRVLGEGSIAILFTFDQSEFGFKSLGGDAGDAVFQFFRRDGSLISTLVPMDLGSNMFGFSRENGIQDIAGISIHNTDGGGIGLDDIRFDVGSSIFRHHFD